MAVKTLAAPAQNGNGEGGLVIPFTKASRLHSEGAFLDTTVSAASFGSGPTQISPADVPAFGYMKSIEILVETDGNGAAGLNNAVSQADAPWDVISSIAFSPDGKRIATAGIDNSVRFWDTNGARLGMLPRGHTPLHPRSKSK